MTRFRVISGSGMVRRTKPVLEIVASFPDLRVEAGPSVTRFTTAKGSDAVVAGSITGHRDADGRLHASGDGGAFLSSLVDANVPEHWSRRFDGDAVVMSIGREGALSLAGDSFFKRDVYVQEAPDGVALASDLSLLPDNPARDGYDTAALAHSMTYYGHRPPKRHTIYRAVRRLGVGESATVRSGKLEIRCAPFQPVMCEEYPDSALDRYAGAFLDYIAAAGSPEGNFVLLSSGWDSSSILAALVRVFGPEKITAVIGRMLYSERSGNCNRFEIERARAIAEFYGVKLHMVDLDYVHPEPEWMHSVRETFRAHNIQSITGLNHARLLHGAAQVGPGLPVFAGETSDGAHNLGFSQYVTIFHPTQGFREYSDKMACYLFGPTFLRELLAGRHEDDAVYRFFRDRNPDALFDDPAPDGPARLRQMLVSFFLRNGRMPLWSGRNVRMLTRNGVDIYTTRMAAEYFQGVESTPAEAIYSWYLHLYNSFHWQGSTVSTVQKMADLFGMRSHNPYWAAGIQDFLRAMPESWGRGLDLNPTKYPLKRMMREKFGHPMDLHAGPHSYTYDVDPTFNHSLEILHHSGLTGYAKKILARKPYHQVLSREMFDIPYLDGVVDKYLGGEEQRGTALNDLVSVFLLCQSGWYA